MSTATSLRWDPNSWSGRFVVSVQAQPHEPLHGSAHMAVMARAALAGGAQAIRCESPADVAAIRAAVGLPLVGLWKQGESGVFITPTRAAASAIADAGADMIALDATDRPRPEALAELIQHVHGLGLAVLADVATVEEGLEAWALGADVVAPTLAGYTGGPVPKEPAWAVLEGLAALAQGRGLWMEGRIWSPAEAAEALRRGADAVVVGSAITRPQLIAARFAEAIAPQGA